MPLFILRAFDLTSYGRDRYQTISSGETIAGTDMDMRDKLLSLHYSELAQVLSQWGAVGAQTAITTDQLMLGCLHKNKTKVYSYNSKSFNWLFLESSVIF